MVDVYRREKCRTKSCDKQPSFGVAGTRMPEYCAQHAKKGTADVYSKKCKTKGCVVAIVDWSEGTRTGEYCTHHASDGIVNVNLSQAH